MSATERLAAFLYCHRRVRHLWMLMSTLWSTSLIAMMCAPRASATVMGEMMSWTGLHDSYGVPIGQHYISLVPVLEAIHEQAPEATADPSTWPTAIGSWVGTMVTYSQLGTILAAECSAMITVVAFTVYMVQFALQTTWLTWLVELSRPMLAQMASVANHMYLAPFSLLAAIVIGAITGARHGHGRGIGIVVGAIAIIAAGWMYLGDPGNDLLGEHGVLGIGKSLGFTVSQGMGHNGALAAGGTAAQADALSTGLVDVLVRRPIEQVNFSGVIDGVGNCGQQYSQALMTGETAAPAHAMAACGAPGALVNARHIDATLIGALGIVAIVVTVMCVALNYITLELFVIGFKAFWNVLILPYAVILAAPPGPTRRFAKGRVAAAFVHGIEYFMATVGLGTLVIMMWNTNSPWVISVIPIGHPIAQLSVMMVLCIGGVVGFAFLMRAFGQRSLAGAAWGVTGGRMWSAFQRSRGKESGDSEKQRSRKNIDDLIDQRRRDQQAQRDNKSGDDTSRDLPARRSFPETATSEAQSTRTKPSPAQAKMAADAAGAASGGAPTVVAGQVAAQTSRSGGSGGGAPSRRGQTSTTSTRPNAASGAPAQPSSSGAAPGRRPADGPPGSPQAPSMIPNPTSPEPQSPGRDDDLPGRHTKPPTNT
ncbi:hypothetical protein [Mycobacteroides chelonae]|uniref:hypothetical protein n=2 Tax=Mycobacteroides chelonae TaxID=1774 RepID=UPI000993EAFB|nr:hypothetical protein [Mycobacteroides chelonae]